MQNNFFSSDHTILTCRLSVCDICALLSNFRYFTYYLCTAFMTHTQVYVYTYTHGTFIIYYNFIRMYI